MSGNCTIHGCKSNGCSNDEKENKHFISQAGFYFSNQSAGIHNNSKIYPTPNATTLFLKYLKTIA